MLKSESKVKGKEKEEERDYLYCDDVCSSWWCSSYQSMYMTRTSESNREGDMILGKKYFSTSEIFYIHEAPTF